MCPARNINIICFVYRFQSPAQTFSQIYDCARNYVHDQHKSEIGRGSDKVNTATLTRAPRKFNAQQTAQERRRARVVVRRREEEPAARGLRLGALRQKSDVTLAFYTEVNLR